MKHQYGFKCSQDFLKEDINRRLQ